MPRTHVWWNTRGPKKTAKETITEGKVRIKQVRSGIGHSWRMRRTRVDLLAGRRDAGQMRRRFQPHLVADASHPRGTRPQASPV